MARNCFRIFGIVMAYVFINGPIWSQEKNVTRSDQQWLHYYNQTRISDRWIVSLDGGFRWLNGFSNRYQYLIRAGAGYELGDGIAVAAGFGHWGTFTNLDVTSSEFRSHQDISLKHGKKAFNVSHRLRIEQRFVKSTNKSSLEFDRFNWRFRYFIGLSFPIKQFSSNPGMALSFMVADELFINAGKEIIYNIFNQNRIVVGPAFDLNNHLSFNFLYQGQYGTFNLPNRYHYDHIFWFTIRHRIDLTKAGNTLP